MKLDKELNDSLFILGSRLLNFQKAFSFYLDFLENEGFEDNELRLISLGLILKEYFTKTKTMFNDIEEKYMIEY